MRMLVKKGGGIRRRFLERGRCSGTQNYKQDWHPHWGTVAEIQGNSPQGIEGYAGKEKRGIQLSKFVVQI